MEVASLLFLFINGIFNAYIWILVLIYFSCSQPPSQRPDFTLDIPGAERLLRKIQASKRQRCWCRLSVSLLGLLFFLLSVMAVSMIYTRGRRLFGSLWHYYSWLIYLSKVYIITMFETLKFGIIISRELNPFKAIKVLIWEKK
jgi:hypothetical protein